MQEVQFSFSEEIVEYLTSGDCWSLAGILHQRTGLPFAAMYGDGEIVHVGIELADDFVVDIEGIWESHEWENRWTDELEDVWEIAAGSIPYGWEEQDALLGYSSMLEVTDFGGITLGSIADEITASIRAFQETYSS